MFSTKEEMYKSVLFFLAGILTNLRKLSFTSMGSSPTEVKGTQHHFTRNGRLVANKQLVFQIDQEVGMESVSEVHYSLA